MFFVVTARQVWLGAVFFGASAYQVWLGAEVNLWHVQWREREE
jgi:hypothetical protein